MSDAVMVSKGLGFPVVALPGVGHRLAPREDEKEAARVFYAATTRATQGLVVGCVGVRLGLPALRPGQWVSPI